MILRKLLKWVANYIKLVPLQILTIFVVLGICSCGSSKKAQKQSEVVKIETSTQSSDSTSLIKENLITATDSTTEDLDVTITEYDTSMPVDSATNKPPVKKELKVKRSKGRKKASEQKHDERKESVSNVAEHVHVQDSVAVQAVKVKQETSIPRQIGYAVKWVCVLAVLLIVLYIARRYWRR